MNNALLQKLKEARELEAMKKGYMGLEGKFSTICRIFGHPILRQGGLHVDRSYLSDPYADDPDEIPTLEDEQESFEIGQQFDGLPRGMNLNIMILHHLRDITVRHEGQIVYKEVGGELEGFAPTDEWEKKIEELYSNAIGIERKRKPFEKRKLIEETNEAKKKILEELRIKWGL